MPGGSIEMPERDDILPVAGQDGGQFSGLSSHPLFSVDHYLAHAQDVVAAGAEPLLHYLRYGAGEGRSPHPFYDPAHVAKQLPGGQPTPNVFVFCQDEAFADLQPHPLFDPHFYRRHAGVDLGKISALLHFATVGARAGYAPHPLFDPRWYEEIYPDVPAGSAFLHFLAFGGRELRDPAPTFSTRWYVDTNPDVGSSVDIPVVHYLKYGAAEGRHPHRLFDPTLYLARLAGDKPPDPYLHYLTHTDISVQPHPLFHPEWYMEAAGERWSRQISALEHFLRFGLERDVPCGPGGRFVRVGDRRQIELDPAAILWRGRDAYRFRSNRPAAWIDDAVDRSPELGVEADAIREMIASGISTASIDFGSTLSREIARVARHVAGAQILIVAFGDIAETTVLDIGELLGGHGSLAADRGPAATLVLSLSGSALSLSETSRRWIAAHAVQGSEIQRNERSAQDLLKCVLMSVRPGRIVLMADAKCLRFLERFWFQLDELGNVTCVLTQEAASATTVAALAELFTVAPRKSLQLLDGRTRRDAG